MLPIYCPGLTFLDLSGCCNLATEQLPDLLPPLNPTPPSQIPYLSNLLHLRLSNLYQPPGVLEESTCLQIIARGRHLSTLALKKCRGVTDRVVDLLSGFPISPTCPASREIA